MAQITLNILGNTAGQPNSIDTVIQKVKTDLKSIENVNVKIGVDAKGVEAATAKINEAAKALGGGTNGNNGFSAQVQQAAQKTEKSTAQIVSGLKLVREQEKQVNDITKELSSTYSNQTDRQIKLTQKYDEFGNKVEEVKLETIDYANQLKKQSDSAELAAKKNSLLGDSLDRIISKIIAWQVINAGVAAMIRGVTDAVQTLKEVDSELVTIRKVTGFSDSQINEIRDQAFETASAYGVGAADYLESVAAFSRAGYREQSAALAELSTKTQIVGDTTAETANQFLLSVDAAYKYKGSIEELSKVLDGANELDNKYATSIEKIAEGMGIVAPVAAQMHVGVDELAAAVGTITAVTQRSGSEAARALRALMLNIVGDTKTEIEEGVTWTTGEIAGLRDVIRQYSPEAYEAAEATKSIIDPMEAIGGLAKAMQDGLLTEQQLMEMVSDIGGKLRTSQLLALIQNWDMYQSMLTDYANAIGSADKEVENALDSWESKTEILKNTWAEFVQNLIDTRDVKDALDSVTNLISSLDTEGGQTTVKVLAISGLLTLLATNGVKIATGVGTIGTAISTLMTAIGGATTATGLFTAVWNASPFVVVTAAVAAVAGIVTLIKSVREELEKADKPSEQVAKNLEKIAAADKYGFRGVSPNDLTPAGGIPGISLRAERDVGRFSKTAEETTEATEGVKSATEALAEQVEAAKTAFSEYNDQIDQLQSALKTISAAQEEYAEYGDLSVDTVQALLALDKEYLDVLFDESGQLDLNSDAVENLIAGKKVLIERLGAEAIAAYAAERAQELLTEQTGNAQTASQNAATAVADAAEAALLSGKKAGLAASGWMLFWSAVQNLGTEAGLTEEYREQLYNDVASYSSEVQQLINGVSFKGSGWTSRSSGKSGSGGSSASSATDARLEELKYAVSFLKQQESYLDESGADVRDRVAKMREIQDALHNQAEYMRSIGADEKDILSLSTEWWTWQNKINKALEDADDTLDRLKDALEAANDEANAFLDAQEEAAVGPLQDQLDLLKAQRDAIEDARTEEERLLAVEEARAALANAQNERTIRQYNARTGQWEWVADAQAVAQAEENLAAAQKALADYYTDREIDALDAQIKSVQSGYDALRDSVKNFASAINDGTVSFLNALEWFTTAAKSAGLGGLAGGLASAFLSAGESTVLAKMKANSAAWYNASAAERADLEAENLRLGTSQGWHRNEQEGVWYDANGNRIYDTGGILRGRGGLKATRRDEMILPPSMTAGLLEAEKSGAFDALLSHLGIVTAAARTFSPLGGSAGNSIGTQNNGDVYQFGSISLTENQARGMSVYDLAQMARTLSLANN